MKTKIMKRILISVMMLMLTIPLLAINASAVASLDFSTGPSNISNTIFDGTITSVGRTERYENNCFVLDSSASTTGIDINFKITTDGAHYYAYAVALKGKTIGGNSNATGAVWFKDANETWNISYANATFSPNTIQTVRIEADSEARGVRTVVIKFGNVETGEDTISNDGTITVKILFLDSTTTNEDVSVSVGVAENGFSKYGNTITYNQNPETAALVANYNVGGVYNADCMSATYQWYKDGSPISGATSSTYVPSGIGEYKVKATVTVTDSNSGVAAGTYTNESGTYTVQKGYATVKTPPAAISGLEYTGSAQELVTAGELGRGAAIQYSLDNATWSTEIPKATDAGTYKVYYKAQENQYFTDSYVESVEVSIAKADPTVPTGLETTYGYKLSNIELPLNWSWVDYTLSVGNAGENTFKANYTPTDNNYNALENIDVTVKVNKAIPKYTVPVGLVATYGDTLADLELPEGWRWEDDPSTPVGNAGRTVFTALFTPEDTDNYSIVTEDIGITVEKATPDVTAPADLTATYGDTLEDVELPDGWTWADPTASVGNAGNNTFKAKYTPTDTNNYNVVENIDVAVIVKQAMPNVTAPGANTGFVYDNTVKTLITAATVTPDLPIEYRLGDNGVWGTELPGATNAGDYTVYYRVNHEDAIGYNPNYETVSDKIENIVIAKADGEITTAPVAKEDLVYNTDDQELIDASEAVIIGGTLVYSTTETGEYTEAIPTGKNAGDYTVWYKLKGDDNHNDTAPVQLEISIAKADQTISVDGEALGEDGIEDAYINCGGSTSILVTALGDATVSYTVDNDLVEIYVTNGMLMVDSLGGATEAIITINVAECDNYNATELTYTVIVEHDHDKTEYYRNEEGHWFECVCGDQEYHEDHIPGTPAGHGKSQICTACGYVLVSPLPHDYSDELVGDATGHYYLCSCGAKKLNASHNFEKIESEEALVHGVTCSTGAVYKLTCVDCGYLSSVTFSVDADGEVGDHIFGEYVSNNNATCTVDGTKTAKCLYCDKTDTVLEKGTAKGHSFGEYVNDNNASCDTNATMTATCSICSETKTKEIEDTATGHTFVKYVYDNNAKCGVDGTKTAKCEYCDAKDTKADLHTALEHSFTKYVSDGNATCMSNGTETAKCDRCDETNTRTAADSALGHSFKDYKPAGDATCTKDGTKVAKCERCDMTDRQADEGSKTGHNFVNGKCSVCGAIDGTVADTTDAGTGKDTTDADKDNGCKSSITGFGVSFIVGVAATAVVALRKKED